MDSSSQVENSSFARACADEKQNTPAQKTNSNQQAHFLIIGSGRMALHLKKYFELLNIDYSDWDRHQDPHLLNPKIESATHILLAISDYAIEGFYKKYLAGFDKVAVHFSGAMEVEGVLAAHPLMSFSTQPYDLAFYKKIHFVICGFDHLARALPGLENNFTVLSAKQKAYYHAICVLGGNFTALLTNKMLEEFSRLQIPQEAARLFVDKTIENIFAQSTRSLTGPLARKDSQTVQKNLEALESDLYYQVYLSFLKVHWPQYPEKPL